MAQTNPNNPIKTGSNWFKEWPLAVVLLLPFLAIAVAWPSLPDRVPMHFDSHGNVNRYGSPLELLILPGINILLAVLLYFVPRLDPKQTNIIASLPAYRWIRVGVSTMLTYIFAITVATSFNPKLEVMPFISIGLLGLFFGLGFAMPKLKQNYMIGIRLPWTLESEDNWDRTHAFAGKLWVRGSLIGIVLSILLPSISLFIALSVVIVLVIWTGIYSYRVFQEEKKRDNEHSS